MNALTARRIKHRCSVKGCANTDVMLVSRSRELAGSVYMCNDCIREAYLAAGFAPVVNTKIVERVVTVPPEGAETALTGGKTAVTPPDNSVGAETEGVGAVKPETPPKPAQEGKAAASKASAKRGGR